LRDEQIPAIPAEAENYFAGGYCELLNGECLIDLPTSKRLKFFQREKIYNLIEDRAS